MAVGNISALEGGQPRSMCSSHVALGTFSSGIKCRGCSTHAESCRDILCFVVFPTFPALL